MSSDRTTGTIDEKGRITIPKHVRERLDLSPGERIELDVENGSIVVRPKISREEFVEEMAGCINSETRREDAPDLDPVELKKDWLSDLPSEP